MSWRTLSPIGWLAIVVVLSIAVIGLSWCAVTAPGRARARLDAVAAAANERARATDAGARDVAGDERLADVLDNAKLKENLAHAIDPLPDARPSDRRRALACARLRDQGTDTTALPACR